MSSNKMRILTTLRLYTITDFCNCFFQNVQIFMVMIPRTRSLVSLYIIYIHKRFICSSGLKYIKKSNSGKPQIVCLKCFSLSKRNIETKYISQSVHFRPCIIHCTVFYILPYHCGPGCLIHIWQNVYLVAKSPTNSNVCILM